MDSFNKSDTIDDFQIGITVVESEGCGIGPALNIYSDPTPEMGFSIERISQNCVAVPLSFTPSLMRHTYLLYESDSPNGKEMVWLLFGEDEKMHLFMKSSKGEYVEGDVARFFPEFKELEYRVLWFDVIYTKDFSKRISTFSLESGSYEVAIIDPLTNNILSTLIESVNDLVSRVMFFSLLPNLVDDDSSDRKTDDVSHNDIHLLVCPARSPSIVFMNVDMGFSERMILEESQMNDQTLSVSTGDINFDGYQEIILGKFGSRLMIYQFTKSGWELLRELSAPGSVFCVKYEDVVGDGMCNLVVSTNTGVHIMQHDPVAVKEVILTRLKRQLDVEEMDDDYDAESEVTQSKHKKVKVDDTEMCEEAQEEYFK